jgi:hypothetical protein
MITDKNLLSLILEEKILEIKLWKVEGFYQFLHDKWKDIYLDDKITFERKNHYKDLIGDVSMLAEEVINENM